jgi:hypothetical protein
MEYDDRLIEDAVLALLATYNSDKGNAWKGLDFEIMNRLDKICVNLNSVVRSATGDQSRI